jgi:hypothetical protein
MPLQMATFCYKTKGQARVDSGVLYWLAFDVPTLHARFPGGYRDRTDLYFFAHPIFIGMRQRDFFPRGKGIPSEKDTMQCQCVERSAFPSRA